jgi:peptidoglycan hydrolase CwlO-like protein
MWEVFLGSALLFVAVRVTSMASSVSRLERLLTDLDQKAEKLERTLECLHKMPADVETLLAQAHLELKTSINDIKGAIAESEVTSAGIESDLRDIKNTLDIVEERLTNRR